MTIFIPTPLRQYAGGKDTVEVSAGTVNGALDELTRSFPDLRKHLFTGEGKLRAFVNVYLNDEDVRYLPEKESTAVSAADTLSIIPSIAGGAPGTPERRNSSLGQKPLVHWKAGE
ncbi:MAG TPA: MoaD/ThiS family protein [Terracidiphilus sp.]|nr:MoaD/ThiS family protein [Terracidiphilus sp.]